MGCIEAGECVADNEDPSTLDESTSNDIDSDCKHVGRDKSADTAIIRLTCLNLQKTSQPTHYLN
jgi:hypothetical protein